MHEANTALLDILVDNSVIIPSFEKDGLLAELQARTSRSCRFCCFFFTSYMYKVQKRDTFSLSVLSTYWLKLWNVVPRKYWVYIGAPTPLASAGDNIDTTEIQQVMFRLSTGTNEKINRQTKRSSSTPPPQIH